MRARAWRAVAPGCRAGRDRSKDRRWILERAPVVQLPWSRRYRSVTGFPRRGHRHSRGCGTPSSPCPWCAARGRVSSNLFRRPPIIRFKNTGGSRTHETDTRTTQTEPPQNHRGLECYSYYVSSYYYGSEINPLQPSTFVTLWFLLRRAHLASRCPHVLGRRDSLFHARALPLMLTHVHRPPFCSVQPGLLGIGSTVRPYDLRTLLAAGVCAARRAPSTHAMFGGSTCPAP